jgi:putative ABC transport system ATP-binding protein
VSAVVELRAAALTYPGPPPVPALRPTDLTVAAGEYVAVVGPSGSGKSTLLNVLGLLDRPTQGSYLLDGHDVGALAEADRTALRARRVGFVFQAFHLLPYRTVAENVAMAGLYAQRDRRARSRAAIEALERVGLSHRLHARAATLSGGERQRVAIARAITAEPSLLLCDEPTGNLDSVTGAGILDLFDELNRAGITIVVITHDPLIVPRAGRTFAIRDGVVEERT